MATTTAINRQPEGNNAEPADLLIANISHLATMDTQRRELHGAWIAINNGLVYAIGDSGEQPPDARKSIDASACLVTPGLINTHHHLWQNLTRAWTPMTGLPLFGWLKKLYPTWTANIDEESVYLAAWVGLAELALSGCTTSSDHHYLHPKRAGDLLGAEIQAAQHLGIRFHPGYGSMSVSVADGGLPPVEAVRDEDDILAESESRVKKWHDGSHGAMIRIALAPCSPFSVTPRLMKETADLAERLDVRLHTHLAENSEDDDYALATFNMRPVDLYEDVGWMTSRSWGAHVVRPDEAEIRRLGNAGVGVAHCPSSNMILSSGIAPSVNLHHAGCPVGLGCDGSSSADAASMWQEARLSMLQGKLNSGADAMSARLALEFATRGGAGCLGREGELGEISIGAPADIALWNLDTPQFAGVIDDLIEGWLRGGPCNAWYTIVAGQTIVEKGEIVSPDLTSKMREHKVHARRFQSI